MVVERKDAKHQKHAVSGAFLVFERMGLGWGCGGGAEHQKCARKGVFLVFKGRGSGWTGSTDTKHIEHAHMGVFYVFELGRMRNMPRWACFSCSRECGWGGG